MSKFSVFSIRGHRLRSSLLAIAAVVVGVPTGAGASLRCPERGGRRWRELAAPRVVLRTDLSERRARALLEEVESAQDALEALGLADRRALPPVDVVVFARRADYRELGVRGSAAFFRFRDLDRRPTVVTYAKRPAALRESLLHELTHHMLRHRLPRAPRWLSEGLAELHQTLRLEPGALVVGEPHACRTFHEGPAPLPRRIVPGVCRVRHIAVTQLPSVGALLAAGAREMDRPYYYSGSWALVHALLLGEPEETRRFESYLGRLAEGLAPNEAWRRSFGDYSTQELDAVVRRHLLRRDSRVRRIPYRPPRRNAPRVRVLSGAEVHVLWATLVRSWPRARAIAHLDEALAHEPPDAEAHYWIGRLRARDGELGAAEHALRSALIARPAERRYRTALAQILSRTGAAAPPRRSARKPLLARLRRSEREARNPVSPARR